MTDVAAEWVRAARPEAAGDFPAVIGAERAVSLPEGVEPDYWEAGGGRPGTRRNPGWRRAEAVASQEAEVWEAERARVAALCEVCGRRRRRAAWAKSCRACAAT